jgi:uncharacterized caspase-like protein
VALVVGNSKYTNISALRNPAGDARLIADTLRGLGFTLVGGGAQVDLDKAALDRAVQNFGAQVSNADVALFYYAGHGIQLHGTNYLVPVDANVAREADADFQMLNVNLVLQQLDPADGPGGRLNVVILDACRNNPFGRGLRSADRGLSLMQAPGGTVISFATQPGAAAQDGDGDHSPFAAALADSIRRPGLGLFDMFNEIGLSVQKATGGTQRPWVSSSPVAGQFYFAGLPSPGGARPAAAPPPVTDPCAAAVEHWRSAEAIGSEAALQDHLARFPNCVFASLAREKLEKLKASSINSRPPAPAAGPQAQQSAALSPLKADVQKVVRIIASDKAKLATYCKLAALDEEMAKADTAKDQKKLDALAKEAEALQPLLGPEYVKLATGLEKVDPASKEGKDLVADFEPLDNFCTKK